MAHHKSAIKRIGTNEIARENNRQYRTKLSRVIKAVISSEKKEEAEPKLKEAVSLLDRLAAKKIIHRNKAANQKSRLAKFLKKLEN
ncbi:30S ribosomal protein S20 [candidate division KSB1 bacterium]|nr:30S ribosomal protein S20 [candidate division KSB1 bacterium]